MNLIKEYLTEQSFAFLILALFTWHLYNEVKFWKELCEKIQKIEAVRLKTYEDFMTRILDTLKERRRD